MDLAMINSLSTTVTERFITSFHSPQNLILALNIITVERMVRWVIIAVFMVLSFYTYIKWYKKNKTTDRQYFEMYNVIIIAGCILMLLISAFFAATALDYYDRYAIIAYPLFISAFLVFKSHSLFSRRMIFAVIGTYYALVAISNYRYTVKEYDQKSLAGYITAIQKKGEPILFYQKVLSLPFGYYYNDKNKIVTLPDSLKFDSTYFSKAKDTTELAGAINAVNTPSNSYLLINDRVELRFQNDADIKMMNDYFNTRFSTTLDTLYYGNSPRLALRVRRLERK
jgi:uncharacterized membrane protein YidH (DUF202 family)